MFRISCLFVFIILSQSCIAQKKYTTAKTASGKVRTTFERGMRMSFNGQYDSALEDLEQTLKLEPNFIDAHIERANILHDKGKYAEAEVGYEKALELDPDYNAIVFYSLAMTEFTQKKFAEAAPHFEQYLATGKSNDKLRPKAERNLRTSRFAAEAVKNPVPFQPKNLGAGINTAQSEYLPTLTADGETLIYCGLVGKKGAYNENEDFFKSKLVNGEWQKGEPIAHLNTPENEASQTISADGKLVVFTACNRPDGLGSCDLYFSETINGKVTPARNLGVPVNSVQWETQPSLSADGKTLYFVRGGKHGQGDSDLWVSTRLPNGKWSAPKNLGANINSKEQEQSPYFHPDGQTLYFTSKGHPGMGGFDIFVSRIQPDGVWGTPKNLGFPINTEDNEGAISISLDGKTAFISSNMSGGFGEVDIYSFDLYEAARPQPVTYVKAVVTDAKTGKKIAAKVEFLDLATGQTHSSASTDDDGEFLVTLPTGKDYALNVSKEKYLFYSENFALTNAGTHAEPFVLKIALTPIPDGTGEAAASKPVVLKNVFFETGSAKLKKASQTELERLKNLLTENPSLHIQINGHTDNVGSDADNLLLSENRAKAVKDFLITNSIAANRLKFKGFGETAPIASNDTEEGRSQNRRTEFVLIQ